MMVSSVFPGASLSRRVAVAAMAALSLWGGLAAAQTFDFSPEQKGRLRADKDAAAIAAIPKGFKFVKEGVFTVAIAPFAPPIATYATDAKTAVGFDPDYAQLIADALGLKLELLPIAWADWPLGLSSGKYDAVISNVGVTEQRKEKYDFSTYRLGLHGFYENLFRLAEDLATVDVLARGRLQVGLSAGAPPYGAFLGERLFDGDPGGIDFSHARVERLRRNLRGDLIGDDDTDVDSPAGRQRPRVQPHAPGLAQRLWYGGGSLRSAQWAGEQGYHLLIGNLNRGETTDNFFEAQRSQLDLFHAHWSASHAPRVALGRVLVPLDSADAPTRARYRAWAATRWERTLAPQGERRTLFARDLVGTSDEILESLRKDPIVPRVQELRLELPYDFTGEDYAQILSDTARFIAPALGWSPAQVPAAPDHGVPRAAATSRPSSITAIA